MPPRSHPFDRLMPALRLLLVLPPLFLLYAGARQLILSPGDFRTERYDSFSLPYWVISVDAIIVAVPTILAGGLCFVSVLRKVRRKVDVTLPTLIASMIPMAILSFAELRVTGRASYVFEYPGTGDFGGTTALGSIATTVFIMLFAGGGAAAATFIYARSIDANEFPRWDRHEDEADPMGKMIQERIETHR